MATKVKISRVVENPKSAGPILVSFEHALGVNKDVDISTRLVGAMYESDCVQALTIPGPQIGKQDKKQMVIIQGETDMTYIGRSDGPLNSNTTGLRTFLAIQHGKKLKLYEATRMTVSPYVGNRPHLLVKEAKKAEEPAEKKRAAAELVKAFGSKKKRLSYERQEKNEIDSEQMNDSINLASENALIPSTLPSPSAASDIAITPPCNRDTKDPRSVYSLHDILTEDDLEGMEQMAREWLNCSDEQIKNWKMSKRFSDYFYEMHRRLSPRKSDPNTIRTAKIVLYTELLISLMKLKYIELKKKALPLPEEFETWLVEKALSIFTVLNAHKVRHRSDAYKDKTCCYIMVLVLIANDFQFDVQLMSTSLQIHITKLLNLARHVGITTMLNPATKEYRGLLKLPLPKPIAKRGRKKKSLK